MTERIDSLNLDSHNFPTGRYEPIELIGRGALGEVFLAKDVKLKRTVAVKRLISITDEQIVLFHREARIASKLNHSNIVTILDFGTTDSGRPFMALEYFNGVSLELFIEQRGRLEEQLIIKLFLTMAEALEYIHKHKIFHRDLKPSNVLLKLDGEGKLVDLRIIDFGLSCIKEEVQSYSLKQGLSLVGTPLYMSPDPSSGLEFDARSEVYSMGCLMYEALTGTPPFDGDAPMELLEKHAHAEPVPLRELVPLDAISPQIEQVVLKCLAKSPADRYQNMREFIEAIEHLQHAPSLDVQSNMLPKSSSAWAKTTIAFCALAIVIGATSTLALVLSASKDGEGDIKHDGAFPRLAPQEFGIGDVPDVDAGERGLYFWGDESLERLEIMARSGKKFAIVTLRGIQIGKKQIELVNKLSPKLLRIQHCEIADEAMRLMTGNLNLTDLVCHDCTEISPVGLNLLRSAPNLTTLVLFNCGVTDAHLEGVGEVTKLRKLVLERNPELTASGLRMLGRRSSPLAVWLDRNLLTQDEVEDLRSKQNIFLVDADPQAADEGLITDPALTGRE